MKQKLKKEVDSAAKKLILMGKSDHEITMNAISEELGMTAPTLYHYYQGKKEILRNAWTRIIDDIYTAFNTPLPRSMTPELQIKTRLTSFISYMKDNPDIMRVIFNDGESIRVEKKDTVKKIQDFKEDLKSILKKYLKKRKKQIPAEKAMYFLLSVISGQLYYLIQSENTENNPGQIVEDVFALWVNGLK